MARLAAVFAPGSEPWDPSHRFATSCLLGPWLLFAVRALFALYAFATVLADIGLSCASPAGCLKARQSFSYFTFLSYWGIAFYFLAAAVHSLTYALSGRPLLARLPRPLQALHALLYTSVVTLPILVTAVFWALLYRGHWFALVADAWRNVSEHILNALFALFEIVVPRTAPLPPVHIVWLLLVLLAYLAVAFITLADQGFYTYRFLDRDAVGGRGYVAAYVVGITVAVVVVFCIASGLIYLRLWLTESRFGLTGKFARPRRQSLAGDAEMNVVRPKPSPDGAAPPPAA